MLRNLPTTIFAFCRHCFSGSYPKWKNFWQNNQTNIFFSISRSIFLVVFVLNASLWWVEWLFCWSWHSMNSKFYRFNSIVWWNEKKRTRIIYNFSRPYYNCTRVCSTTVTTAPMERYTRISKITHKKAKMAIHGVMAVIISFYINVFQRLVTLQNTKVGKCICTKIMDFDLIFLCFSTWFGFRRVDLIPCRLSALTLKFFSFATSWREPSLLHVLHHSRNGMSLEKRSYGESVFLNTFSLFYCAFCIRAFRKIQE